MGLHEILPPGAGQNRVKLGKDVEEYHMTYGINFDETEREIMLFIGKPLGRSLMISCNETDINTFIARRPDGLAFDKEKKMCVFLEYTRAMDT